VSVLVQFTDKPSQLNLMTRGKVRLPLSLLLIVPLKIYPNYKENDRALVPGSIIVRNPLVAKKNLLKP